MPVASLLIGLLLTAVPGAGAAPADAELLRQAEAAFHDGVRLRDQPAEAGRAFREAAERYAALRERGCVNAALLRDEGDAHLLAGDLPEAVLACRRGLRLAPNDRLLRRNLDVARGQVVLTPPGDLGHPPVDALPPWLPWVPSALVLALALVLYVLGCAAVTRWWMVRRPGLLTGGLLAFVVALSLGGVLGWRTVAAREEARHPLVVIADDGVLLRRGNGLAYPARYERSLNRGVEARLLYQRGDWVKIELAGGQSGWVARRYVLIDGDERVGNAG